MYPPALNPALAVTDLSLYLPVLGLTLLCVVMISLSLRRERWIIPGTLAGLLVSLAAFGLVEYRDQLNSALARRPAPVAPAPAPAPVPEVTAPAEPVPPPEPPRPASPPVQPVPPTPKLISVDPNQIKNLPKPAAGPGDLKTIRETPAPTTPPPAPPPAPAPKPVAVATPPPAPAPAPKLEPVVTPLPAPKPTPPPAPVGPPPPKTAPANGIRLAVAGASATSGHLQVQIQGPLLEIVKEHNQNAHLMLVVDGKYKQVIAPTRIKEDRAHTELGGSGQITAINYFWENVSVTFENLDAGAHSVMIDVSLEDPSTHFSKMVGSESTKNDWNGFVDVVAGQTTTIVFGGKNWMSQQLDRLR
jgi:hypothetical protein